MKFGGVALSQGLLRHERDPNTNATMYHTARRLVAQRAPLHAADLNTKMHLSVYTTLHEDDFGAIMTLSVAIKLAFIIILYHASLSALIIVNIFLS